MKLYITICLIFFNLALIQNASCFVFHPDTLVKTSESKVENAQSKTISLHSSLAVLNNLLNEEALDQDTSRSKELVNKAHSLFNKVKSESRIVEFVDFSRTQTLPLAINKNMGGLDYMIVFDSITLTPNGGLITSYMSLEVPQNGKRLAFRGGNIKFNRSGIYANARLDLIEDFPIKIGEKTLLNLKADQRKTYVNFDCKGFTDMGVQAELEFSRDLIVPENTDGSLIPAPARVKGKFEVVQMREWGEILAKINLPAFQVNGLTGFGFKVTDAIFDFSETANASGIKFPQDYGNVDPLWQGVYIRHANISLPSQFKSTERKRLEFFTHDLLIDEVGISGMIGTKNLLVLDKGDMDSWRFSIDSLYLGLNRNQLVGGGLGGLMQVPLFGDDPLKYSAAINIGGNYLFSVTTSGAKKIPLWAAEAQIDQGSLVEIRVIEDRFLPKILLNGKLTVGSDGKSEARVADISFEQLQLQTIAPYIKVGSIKLGSEKLQQKMNNFPVTLKNIGVISKDNDIGLNLEAIVIL